MSNHVKPINPFSPFSPGYVSRLVPFKKAHYRPRPLAPDIRYSRDNIAPNEDGKRARLLKANI